MQAEVTVWKALAGNPLRFLTSSWPWRSFAYVASTTLIGPVVLCLLVGAIFAGAALSLILVGVLILMSIPLLGVGIGAVERRRLRLMRHAVPSPHAAMPADARLRQRMAFRRREPASLRELGYAVITGVLVWPVMGAALQFTLLVVVLLLITPFAARYDTVSMGPWQIESFTEALPFALVGAPLWWAMSAYVLTLLAAAQAELARALLGPREDELRRHIAELRRSRLDLVDAFETERRRIERHLHDGVQQRLVGLTMTLGLAEYDLPDGEPKRLVERAHAEAEAALADLREAVRGIHPRVLVDHGLEAAVREVADRSPLPVTVRFAIPDRLPPPVEAAAYFMVSEALANVAKHAQASTCEVAGWVTADRLVVTVRDDGVGGAEPSAGTGLPGLVTRLDALGGTLDITSPPGGPTTLRMESPRHLDPV
jgi:signal transduction histidine kinase